MSRSISYGSWTNGCYDFIDDSICGRRLWTNSVDENDVLSDDGHYIDIKSSGCSDYIKHRIS